MKLDLTVGGYLIDKNKVLLIHHKKLEMWLPVGGHINSNESPDESLKREFKEEVGLDVEVLYCNVHSVGYHDHYGMYFVCKIKKDQKIKLQKSEVINFEWFSKRDLGKNYVSVDVRNIALLAFKSYEENENE